MNNLMVFHNTEFGQVRTLTIDDAPWFVGKDVAEALGYSNPQKAVRDHVDEDDRGVNNLDTPGGKQAFVIINESGLYALIFGSKLDSAKKFKRWVTSEVLPALRKTGRYEMPGRDTSSIDDIMDTIQLYEKLEERGHSSETIAQLVNGVYARRYGRSENFLSDTPKPKKFLPKITVSDEQLHECVTELKKIGLVRKDRILIPAQKFNEFCKDNKISPNKYRRWLYQNEYILAGQHNSGKIAYTRSSWIDGRPTRCVAFKKI